ncbi:copper fist DNA binding domain-containing protein [Circinella umbellata]|nr:copper fist DNA binding domain-containing protein [Circinella umbellata]
MVFYDGVKFACLSCIRGHRSSNCNHVDRPLMEVRKKGRPVSQCAYCRDLRKTKQIHAKCVCTTANNNNNKSRFIIIQLYNDISNEDIHI